MQNAETTEQGIWKQRAALFDEACALPEDARISWLSSLSQRAPEHVAAITKMLREFDNATAHTAINLNIAGAAAQEFAAQLDSATTLKAAHLNANEHIGAWQLIKKIGEGGMGEVWLAKRADATFEGQAAIKFLRADLTNLNTSASGGENQIVSRFLRERRLLARLTHPGIARMLDAGTHNGEPYLVMEYISGTPITTWAAGNAPRVIDRVNLILKVCRAAEHAHSQLIVHRDLKPNNVLVNAAGEPSLLDFGIAKLIIDEQDDVDTQTALTRLNGRGYTLGYCAPEQITGEATSVGVDVFSIGVMFFESLTGGLPFKNEGGRAAIEHAIIHTDAPSLSKALESTKIGLLRPIDAANARGDLEAIVAKALRKNPADRYVTVSALASDLHRWLNNQPVQARRGNWQYMTKLWFKRNKALAIVGTAAFVAVNIGLVVARMQTVRANDEATRANLEAKRADSERETAVAQRRLAEIATAQTTSALADSENAKANAIHAEKLAEQSAAAARASAKIATANEAKSRAAEIATAAASQAAKSEAAKATAVSQYLVTLFESADPERTKGDKLTLREVLDAGATNVNTQFANQPETLAEMQGVLGKTYVSLSQPKTALPLLEAVSTAMEKKHGVQSVQFATALYHQARAENDIEQFAKSITHYQQALTILEQHEPATGEIMAQGNIFLSYALQKQGKFADAEKILGELRAKVINEKGDKSWLYAEVENARAVVASGQGKVKDEIEVLKAVEPLLINPPLGKKNDALTIRNNLAVGFARTNNFAEATLRMDGVIADSIALVGDQGEITLRSMWFAGEMLRLQGRYRECLTQFERLAGLRVRASSETNTLTVDVFSKTATCANSLGDAARAETYANRAYAALPASDNPPQRNVLRTLTTLQIIALDTANLSRANTIGQRLASLKSALNLNPATPEATLMAVSAANIAARSQNFKAALAEIETLAKLASYASTGSVRAINAYLLALDGQRDRARAEAQLARTLSQARFAPNHPVYHTLNYLDAIIANPADAAIALAALKTAAGREVNLPLAPNWFGL